MLPSGVTHSNRRCGPVPSAVDGSSELVATAHTVSPRLNLVVGVVQSLPYVAMPSEVCALPNGGRTIIVIKTSMPRQASPAMMPLPFGFRTGPEILEAGRAFIFIL